MIKIFFIILILFVFTISPSYAQSKNTVTTRVGNPSTAGPGGTAPPPPDDIRQGIIDTFGITMGTGFDNDHLRWTWERLWEAGTGFTNKLRGARVEVSDSYSAQVGCFGGGISLYLGQYQGRDFFKFIVLHEFGHVFQACNPRSVTKQVEQMNAYDSEGGVSYYARNATSCISGVSNYGEDYADMLAYYLDRASGYNSGPKECGPSSPPNPYGNGGFPLHLSVAQMALQ